MQSVETLEAGAELDAQVAVQVMGWQREECVINGHRLGLWFRKPGTRGKHGLFSGCPHYSTDIRDAWQIVERLKERTPVIEYFSANSGAGFVGWRALFRETTDFYSAWVLNDAETAPLALCRAALKVIAHA